MKASVVVVPNDSMQVLYLSCLFDKIERVGHGQFAHQSQPIDEFVAHFYTSLLEWRGHLRQGTSRSTHFMQFPIDMSDDQIDRNLILTA